MADELSKDQYGVLREVYRRDEEDRDRDPNTVELGMIVKEQLAHLAAGSSVCQHQIYVKGQPHVVIVLPGNMTEQDFVVVPGPTARVGEGLGYGGEPCGDLEPEGNAGFDYEKDG